MTACAHACAAWPDKIPVPHLGLGARHAQGQLLHLRQQARIGVDQGGLALLRGGALLIQRSLRGGRATQRVIPVLAVLLKRGGDVREGRGDARVHDNII